MQTSSVNKHVLILLINQMLNKYKKQNTHKESDSFVSFFSKFLKVKLKKLKTQFIFLAFF